MKVNLITDEEWTVINHKLLAEDWTGYEEATTEEQHLILILKLEKVLSQYAKTVRHGPPKHSVLRELRRLYSNKKKSVQKTLQLQQNNGHKVY